LVEPPEHFGAFKVPTLGFCEVFSGFVDWFRLDELVGLLPESYFARISEKPAISNNSMDRGVFSGKDSRLAGCGHGGKRFFQGAKPAIGCDLSQFWRVFEKSGGKTYSIDQDEWLKGFHNYLFSATLILVLYPIFSYNLDTVTEYDCLTKRGRL
jgi:hypothetical protein